MNFLPDMSLMPKWEESKDPNYEFLCRIGNYDVCLWHGAYDGLGPSWCVRYGPGADYSSGPLKFLQKDVAANGKVEDLHGNRWPVLNFLLTDKIHQYLLIGMLMRGYKP